MLRNREVRRALIACLLVTVLGTVATYLVTRTSLFTAICTLATGLIVTVIFMILTNRRYRALAKMAANLDRAWRGRARHPPA